MNDHDHGARFYSIGSPAASRRRPRRASIGCERLEERRLLSTLGQDVTKLATDLGSIHAGSSITAAELKAVGSDFQAIAKVATKPSASSVAALESELKVVIEQRSITPSEALILEADTVAVLASADIPLSLADQTASDVKAVVTSSGITTSDVELIAGDLSAIVNDLSALKK
jgi:hypothetical protein